MLDIGVIVPELAKYGGAERFIIECVTRWQKKHRITLYATGFAEDILREHGVNEDVKLIELSPYFEGPHAMFLNAGLLPKVWECEIGAHDVYQTHLCPTHLIDVHPVVWYPHEPSRMIYDLKYDQPYPPHQKNNVHVYPKHTYDTIEGDMYQPYAKAAAFLDRLITADTIIANSRFTAAYLESVYNRKVPDVVYPGVNLDDFLHMPLDENVLLTVGQLWPHKRIKLILEAVRYIEDVQLYVVGNGPERDRLKEEACKLGVSDRVFFLEGLTNHEVQILFARCLAVVFTPIREPFGIVALEAMAAGRPLIGVNEGGFTEVVNPSCAFLIPPSPYAIAEKVRYLIDNKQVAREMGAAGLEKAREYTWDRTADTVLS